MATNEQVIRGRNGPKINQGNGNRLKAWFIAVGWGLTLLGWAYTYGSQREQQRQNTVRSTANSAAIERIRDANIQILRELSALQATSDAILRELEQHEAESRQRGTE